MIPPFSEPEHFLPNPNTSSMFITVAHKQPNAEAHDSFVSAFQSFAEALQALSDSNWRPRSDTWGTNQTRVHLVVARNSLLQTTVQRVITSDIDRIMEMKLNTRQTGPAEEALILRVKTFYAAATASLRNASH